MSNSLIGLTTLASLNLLRKREIGLEKEGSELRKTTSSKKFLKQINNEREKILFEKRSNSNYTYSCKIAKYILDHKESHKKYQNKAREIITSCKEKLDNLHFKNTQMINELANIYKISKNYKTKVMLDDAKLAANDQEDNNDPLIEAKEVHNDRLDRFFQEFEPKNEYEMQAKGKKTEGREKIKQLEKEKELLKDNFSVYGKFPLYFLRNSRILVNIQLQGAPFENLIKKSSLIFVDNGDQGFRVTLVYVEKTQKFVVKNYMYEAILDSFIIDTKSLLDLRRRKSTKATIKFGGATFNIYELVNFLNSLCSSVGMPD